ncbi:glycosyltransferase family 39 protein [Secundilactobacillus kimchicus]|uniref:glycosyltransferase family 39 protein n=1 Tax=Secundilactobacillus kimchicus TaxID=528209 RepID=UPI0024A9AAE6|nr:glycosyltransferase family 39 protein [Secundilactobacillus kimchicus]
MATNSIEPSSSFKQPKRRFNVDWILSVILLLALFLYGWQIWKAGSANSFYTAAIESMTQSFKNFWYASFDPAGYITVDKPPVALWFMAISAKVFGLHGWSIVLPSVLFGVGSVYLMYRLVKPYFGRLAGNLAALAMTITPIVVADSRTNNMDATLVFFLLLAFLFLEKAIDRHSTWWLVGSFALIGVAFNVKMLQAFMVLPAMYLFYWIAAKENWKKKILKTVYATVALVVFTLAWPLSVDLTSASNRPYEGGSEHNSVLELAFGYNGSERLLGQTTGTGGAFPGMGNNKSSKSGQPGGATGSKKMGTPPTGSKNAKKMGTPPSGTKGKAPEGMGAGGPGGKVGSKKGGMGGGGGAFNIGTAGPFRLFQQELGPQISWLLPFAIFGLLGGLTFYRDRKRKWYAFSHEQKQLVLWAGWLVPVYGFFHPYYTIMLAPAIAALFGIGVKALTSLYHETGLANWRFYLLPLALTSTAALQAWYVYDYYPWLTWLILGLGIVVSLALIFIRNRRATLPLISLGLLGIMIAPGWWSLTPTIAAESAQIPTAGPDLLTSNGGGGMAGGMGDQINTKLLNYVVKHQGNAKYLFATADSSTAAPYIIKTGKAVMAMGGFNGTDPAMTLKQFKKLVKTGQLKYYYDGGKSGGSTNNAIVSWIKKHATKVKSSEYQSTTATSTTNKQPSTGTTTPPTSGHQGKKPTMKPGKKPTGNGKAPASTIKKSITGQSAAQPGGGMGGPNSSGTLYDLSTIFD